MEAEYVSTAESCKEAMYLRTLECEVIFTVYPIALYNESSAQK